MREPHLLVVAVDGLRASALGAYGNTSFATPSLDRLAAESFLVDWCFAASPELPQVYRSLWQSAHVLRPAAATTSWPSLPRRLRDRGYATTLVTDEAQLPSLAGAAEFDQCVQLAGTATTRADDLPETLLARLTAAACDSIEQGASPAAAEHGRPQLVWVHYRGLYGPWDAPLQLQESLLDEGDPAPYEAVAPPDVMIGDQDDPDAAFLYGCAYAAQVMVLDECLEWLMAAAHTAWAEARWMLVLLGVRGFPLGQHGRVGGVDGRLFAEQLHVPWLVRFPDGSGRLARSSGLVSHIDLLPTLVEWIAGAAPADGLDGMSILPLVRQPRPAWRDALVAAGTSGARAIRTPGWCLRCAAGSDEAPSSPEGEREWALYVRPDDRWEANDVAKLCPDVVAGLTQAIAHVASEIGDGRPVPSKKLPDELSTSVD